MSEPFGDDETDFDTTALVESAYNNVIDYLSEDFAIDGGGDAKLINPLLSAVQGKRCAQSGHSGTRRQCSLVWRTLNVVRRKLRVPRRGNVRVGRSGNLANLARCPPQLRRAALTARPLPAHVPRLHCAGLPVSTTSRSTSTGAGRASCPRRCSPSRPARRRAAASANARRCRSRMAPTAVLICSLACPNLMTPSLLPERGGRGSCGLDLPWALYVHMLGTRKFVHQKTYTQPILPHPPPRPGAADSAYTPLPSHPADIPFMVCARVEEVGRGSGYRNPQKFSSDRQL